MMRTISTFAALSALCVVVACGDTGSSSAALVPANHPAASGARLRGTVDVATGTLTFAPVPASAGPSTSSGGPNAQIYGNQGVDIRIYNSAVVISAPTAGKKTYSANVGLRNLHTFRIGDEQGALAPPDTLGIYVFVSGGPTVTGTSSTCPACAVTVKNARGVLNFNAPNQSYWFWTEVVGPANGGADTTLNRKPWIFEADTAVTRFTFDVLVSTAWVAPNETRWKVDYEGDSLPDTQSEPRWRLRRSGNGVYTATSGILNVNPGPSSAEISFYRRDSLATTTSAYVEGRLQYTAPAGKTSTARLVIDDAVRFIAFGVSGSQVGFVDTSNTFLPGTAVTRDTRTAYHVYTMRKYAADSVVYFVDAVRGGKLNYSAFPGTAFLLTAPLFQFGMAGPDNGICDYDYVIYEIGTPVP